MTCLIFFVFVELNFLSVSFALFQIIGKFVLPACLFALLDFAVLDVHQIKSFINPLLVVLRQSV